MKLVQVKISELFGSEVLARNVFWKQQLFIARGSILTKKMISLLKLTNETSYCYEFNVAEEIKAVSTFFVISMQEQPTSLSENEASVNVDLDAFSFLFLRYEGFHIDRKLKLGLLFQDTLNDKYCVVPLLNTYLKEKISMKTFRLLPFIEILDKYADQFFVLFSDGSLPTAEKPDVLAPLFPSNHVLQSGQTFILRVNSRLTIDSYIYCHVDKPIDLIIELTDFIFNLAEETIENYFMELKSEWFTRLFIPIYEILYMIKKQKKVEERLVISNEKRFKVILLKAIIRLRLHTKNKQSVLIITDNNTINPLEVLLLEGVLYTKGLNSIIKSSEINYVDLQRLVDYGGFSRIFLLGKNDYPLIVTTNKVRFYSLKETELQNILFKLASEYPQQMDIIQELEKYYFVFGTK